MKSDRSSLGKKKDSYVEVPGGILTEPGIFYHIDSKGIEKLIPGLLSKVDLADVLKEADAKATSPYYLAYFGFLTGLFFSVWIAFGALIACFALGRLAVTLMTGPLKGKFHIFLAHESISILITGLILIYFGYYEQLQQLGLGLGVFVLLRVVLILSKGSKKNTIPNKNDRILHFALQRYALLEGLNSPLIDEMQEQILHYYHSSAQRKNSSKRS